MPTRWKGAKQMNVTRNVNGAIQVNGRRINMYILTCWLLDRNNRTGKRLSPSTLTDAHIQEYLDECDKPYR